MLTGLMLYRMPPDPPGAFKINGVSDILYLGNDTVYCY